MSLLVGPGGKNLDFFSLTGSNVSSSPSPFDISFVDTASGPVEGNLAFSGSFMPTSLNTDITYPQCPANASLCATANVGPPLPANPFTPTAKADPAGTSVLGNPDEAGVFGGTTASTYNGNGTWSLYIDDGGPTGGGEQTTVGGGWCVNLTVNLPTIALSSQSPSTFVQGGTGSLPEITVTNNGPGPIGDPTQTNANAMTVTDTLPTGLTYSGNTGTDWSCSATGQTVVCRNEDTVAASGTYSPLTIGVKVSNTASGPIGNNAVSVSDGVAANTPSPTSAAVTIDVPPAINSANNTTISQGAALNFSVTSTGYPTPVTLTVSNVQNPIPGITIPTSSTTGTLMLTGTPTASGTSTFTITASNGVSPDATQDFTLTVDAPPTVTTTTPANGATGVSPTSTVSFTFNKAVNVTASAFTLQCPSGKSIAFKLSPTPPGGTTSFTLTPSANLPYGVSCTATAVASQIADLFGTPLATNYSFSFTTITLTPAALTSPSGGSVLAGPTVTFNWAAPPSATGYGLRLGTTVGGNNLWSSGPITATTATAKGLPTDGSTVYVRLYTAYGSVDVYKDYTFTAATRAALTSPAGDTTLAGPTVTFDWTTAAGATGYAIRFGTTVGGNNIWSSGPITTTSATAKALPTSGGTVYARLYTAYGSTEVYTDYTFTAATRAALTSPLGGSVLTGTTETFNWTTATGASGYAIRFGTTVGGNDIWSSGPITTTSATAKKLPTNGTTVYARLYTAYGSTEAYTDYTFTASTAP